jgi:hypothetical protein
VCVCVGLAEHLFLGTRGIEDAVELEVARLAVDVQGYVALRGEVYRRFGSLYKYVYMCVCIYMYNISDLALYISVYICMSIYV